MHKVSNVTLRFRWPFPEGDRWVEAELSPDPPRLLKVMMDDRTDITDELSSDPAFIRLCLRLLRLEDLP